MKKVLVFFMLMSSLMLVNQSNADDINDYSALNQFFHNEENEIGPGRIGICRVACLRAFPSENLAQWTCLRACEFGEARACEMLFSRCMTLPKNYREACVTAYNAYGCPAKEMPGINGY